MTERGIYMVFDNVGNASQGIFESNNDRSAHRAFQKTLADMVRREGVDNRSDFALYRLCKFHPENLKDIGVCDTTLMRISMGGPVEDEAENDD